MIKNYENKKSKLLSDQNYCCASCGEPFIYGQKIDLAHKVSATKFCYKKYGEEVIDHEKNLAATHANGHKGLACNDFQTINKDSIPGKKHLKEIEECLKD